jgi:hypothetical protein
MVSLNIRSLAGEVEDFPWEIVNGLVKGSPYVLRIVQIHLLLRVETHPQWGITSFLDLDSYESYFRQVRSALPDLDKILITCIAVRQSSHLFANLTSLCSTRSMKDFTDEVVCDTTDEVVVCDTNGIE